MTDEYIIVIEKIKKVCNGVEVETCLIDKSKNLTEDFIDTLWSDYRINIDKISSVWYKVTK